MENNMTILSGRMYEQAASGLLTVHEAIDFLEKEAKMRTLREKLEKFAHGHDLNTELVQGLIKDHPDLSADIIERRVGSWLSGSYNQTLKKSDAIEICFILGLSLEEADAFTALACEEGLHWRNPDEIVYIFALKQGMEYSEASKLNEEVIDILSAIKKSGNLTEESFTSVIRSEITALETKEELIEYLKETIPRLGRCHNNAYKLFMDMMDALEHPKLYETEESAELFEPEKLTVRDILNEYLYESNVIYAREKAHAARRTARPLPEEEKFVLSVIQKNVSDNWPNEITIAKMKSREIDVSRKILILLFLATDQGPMSGDEDDIDFTLSEDEIFEDLHQRLNDMLLQCGFMTLDPRSPFDWLILYCICAEDMFDLDIRMKTVFKEMFGERT